MAPTHTHSFWGLWQRGGEPLVGIIGSMQAAEALKVLVGMGTPLCGRLLVMDALHMELRTVKLSRNLA